MPQIKMIEKHDTHFVIERMGQKIVWPKDGFIASALFAWHLQTMLTGTEIGQVVEGWEF